MCEQHSRMADSVVTCMVPKLFETLNVLLFFVFFKTFIYIKRNTRYDGMSHMANIVGFRSFTSLN